MRCLYCDEDYMHNSSIYHYLFSGDMLCEKCRKKLLFKPERIIVTISFTGIRKLKIRTVAASISHTSLRAVCMRRNYLSRRSRGLRITEAYTAELLKNEDYMRL